MRKKMFYGADRFIFERAKELRNNMTPEELMFWGRLKQRFPDLKFRRQHPVANYIADFYCHFLKLVIEIDGSIHLNEEVLKNDHKRQKELEALGITVIRFTNEQLKNDLDSVLNKVAENINNKNS